MRSLTLRLTVWYACVVTATVALVLWIGKIYLEDNLLNGIDFLNDAEFEEILHRLQQVEEPLNREDLVNALRRHTEIDAALFFFQVNDLDGHVLFSSSNLGSEVIPVERLPERKGTLEDEELGHLRVGRYEFRDLEILIASSLQSADSLFGNYNRMVLLILLVVLVVSVGLGLLLSRLALNPVNRIQAIARRISGDNLSERIPVPASGDEISRLSEFLNEMFDRLEKSFQQISRFTADASHELRTPLSLIRLHSERLLRNPDLAEPERIVALQEQMAEIEHLNKLIDDLLFLARADAGVLRLKRKHVDLHRFLQEFTEDAQALCEDQQINFELFEKGTPGFISMDPIWMRHVFLNLLSNSMKVSGPGGLIRLYSQPAGKDTWRFVMEDQGPGLDPEQLRQIFERFKHIPGNSQMDTPVDRTQGTGLGLAICLSIVSQHQGLIEAQRRDDRQGLRMVVELPTG